MNNTSNHKELVKENLIIKQDVNAIPKPLDELNMMDAFLFEAMTEDIECAKKVAQIIVERVIGEKVGNLVVETQKQLKGINVDTRGIRMDIYTTEWKESEGKRKAIRIFDIEPNNYRESNLPYRNRFYQSMIDAKLLSVGTHFSELPEVIMIWILPYDPFGENRIIYHVKNMVAENNQIVYNDGVLKLFLYTRGTKGGSKKLKELLKFMENSTAINAVDDDLEVLQKMIQDVKSSPKVRNEYMNKYFMGVTDYERRDTYIKGIITGGKLIGAERSKVREAIMQELSFTEDLAEEFLKLYW